MNRVCGLAELPGLPGLKELAGVIRKKLFAICGRA